MSNDNNQLAQQLGKELLNSAATGLAGGLGAGSLYYLLAGLNKADPAELVPQFGVSGAANKKLRLAKKPKKELPSRAKNSPINMYKSANSFVEQLQRNLGAMLPKSYVPGLGRLLSGGPAVPAETGSQEMWRTLANFGLAGAGAYTGLKAVNSIADTQRRADIKDDVEAAREEYFAALTGKNAEYIDAAFDAIFTKNAAEESGWSMANFLGALDRSSAGQGFGKFVALPAAAAMLGGGLMGGTYMYKQVKDRTRAENLRRAAAARARLAGLQETPYVDPVELAALTKK